MKVYEKMLRDAIDKEKRKEDYIYFDNDRALLDKLFEDLNRRMLVDFHYLAEIDYFQLPNTADIMIKYIKQFESESIRGYLLPHIVNSNIKDIDFLILELYANFRSSNSYISPPNIPAPSHICARYDTAFTKLKSKKIAYELKGIIQNPRDAYYLPLTTEMLARWKIPNMEDILLNFLYSDNITYDNIGLEVDCKDKYYPSLETIQRELRFVAIRSLKFFPTLNIYDRLRQLELLIENDTDTILAIRKTLKTIEKALS